MMKNENMKMNAAISGVSGTVPNGLGSHISTTSNHPQL
jgi:hypothetical protein